MENEFECFADRRGQGGYLSNKNTRTLGAGDYPALKFFFVFNYQTHVRFCFSK